MFLQCRKYRIEALTLTHATRSNQIYVRCHFIEMFKSVFISKYLPICISFFMNLYLHKTLQITVSFNYDFNIFNTFISLFEGLNMLVLQYTFYVFSTRKYILDELNHNLIMIFILLCSFKRIVLI